MITLDLLDRVKLYEIPYFSIFIARTFLATDYKLHNLKIIFEGTENLPKDTPVIFAMNHTDRYNYWPFQYYLYRSKDPNIRFKYTSTWIKGKYIENPLMAKYFSYVNAIPIPSKGYLLIKDFEELFGKQKMSDIEYRFIRDYVDGKISMEDLQNNKLDNLIKTITTKHGDFDPDKMEYRDFIRDIFTKMMSKVRELNKQSIFEKNLHLTIFPEGTRSSRLKKGHIGLSEVALSLNVPVVPVGCNGSEKCYPGNSPIITKNCKVIYRIGKPMTINDELKPYKIEENFIPFTPEAELKYKKEFEGATNLIMGKINDLLDPEYQFSGDDSNKTGINRFV